MLTRGEVGHAYYPRPVQPRVNLPGTVAVTTVKGIPQTWAISRPGSFPEPNGAPHYFQGYAANSLQRGPAFPLRPVQPRVEMDPSNPATWQRSYRFTN